MFQNPRKKERQIFSNHNHSNSSIHPNIQIHPLRNKIHVSKVHCGSAFEPGASGLPYYCTSIYVRFWCNCRWRNCVDSKPKKKKFDGKGFSCDNSFYEIFFGWPNPWHITILDFGNVQVNHLFYGDTSTGRECTKNRGKTSKSVSSEKAFWRVKWRCWGDFSGMFRKKSKLLL